MNNKDAINAIVEELVERWAIDDIAGMLANEWKRRHGRWNPSCRELEAALQHTKKCGRARKN